nr:secreted protein [Kibdelosporangium sp. MJ126-NF4]
MLTTTGNDPDASAAGANKSQYVDITTVKPNVQQVGNKRDASKGTFTVNCGRNENGHFNADNFIAQPGIKMGAEHLHDYVGNLSANANSNNKSLAKSGTTCKNGDKSAYFWPVVRINTKDRQATENGTRASDGNWQRYEQEQQDAAVEKNEPRVDCKDVASELPEDLPDEVSPAIEQELKALDTQREEADKKLEGTKNADQEVVSPLTEQRKQTLTKLSQTLQQQGKAKDLSQLAQCGIKQPNNGGVTDNGDQNNDVNTEGTDRSHQHKPGDQNLEIGINKGTIQRPVKAELTFRGNPNTKIKAMPRFMRILTGDAKVSTNGQKNARKVWTCTGFENKVLLDKYPICPQNSQIMRIHDFPSCWDGKNVDSANHRDHIVHREANGTCKRGFVPVPELRISLTYNIPRDVQLKRQFTLDSFAQEKNNPASDHNDFANVMSECIMFRLVKCINSGKRCTE